jgi:hypothetical protein
LCAQVAVHGMSDAFSFDVALRESNPQDNPAAA